MRGRVPAILLIFILYHPFFLSFSFMIQESLSSGARSAATASAASLAASERTLEELRARLLDQQRAEELARKSFAHTLEEEKAKAGDAMRRLEAAKAKLQVAKEKEARVENILKACFWDSLLCR